MARVRVSSGSEEGGRREGETFLVNVWVEGESLHPPVLDQSTTPLRGGT